MESELSEELHLLFLSITGLLNYVHESYGEIDRGDAVIIQYYRVEDKIEQAGLLQQH
jgi:hypothetical protein